MLTLLPLAQAAPSGGLFGNPLLLLGLLFLVMWFTMIRPQTKQAKAHRELVEGLSKGDRIVTVGGIHGTIRQVDEKTILVEVDGGTKLRIDKGKVGYTLSSTEPA
ncbi:preprotein translocase subunit YajC [Rubrivirga marina]|uniref:Sec translocon accessory complex subunit YajC n=1 Tax=Rubrivirga marina TaxID=1196024 RepID=A0A271IVA9_9BACT|nr:preprotein translocase subunit YajC [Rubrivirga marina]PAP75153.1 preprotein translocase subunit YajC [Rubrivirga marina]